MSPDIVKIFTPSLGVDLVADINSLTPTSWSSIIYDVDYKLNTITIAQPLAPIDEKNRKKKLYLTTIIQRNHSNIRVGVSCEIKHSDNEFSLANGSTTKAVVLTYFPPVVETNIRSAYRLPLSKKHTIKAKLRYKGADYYTSGHFSIRDISFSGIALLVPGQLKGAQNPIAKLKRYETFMLGMTLIHRDERIPAGTFAVKAQVARIHSKFADSHLLVGLRIIAIAQESEEILSRFIHNAQIDELKRLRSKAN